jgi:hypothetical protein
MTTGGIRQTVTLDELARALDLTPWALLRYAARKHWPLAPRRDDGLIIYVALVDLLPEEARVALNNYRASLPAVTLEEISAKTHIPLETLQRRAAAEGWAYRTVPGDTSR